MHCGGEAWPNGRSLEKPTLRKHGLAEPDEFL